MKAQKDLRKLANKTVAEKSKRFFKTAKGEYAYGDLFLGVPMPKIRLLAKKYIDLSFSENQQLIQSKYHEDRLLGLTILVYKYEKAKTEIDHKKIYQNYIKNFKYINNWDLVDCSCHKIVGKYLLNKDRKILYKWAKSDHLWTRRISIITNWWFIREGDLKDVFKLSKLLLNDEHDLMHKAVGWMLREAASKDLNAAENFLKKNYLKMPRTMLRYAIEKFPEPKRQKYLKGKI